MKNNPINQFGFHIITPATSQYMSLPKEQITLTVPRGTRAWFRKLSKLGITPEQVFRLGLTEASNFISKYKTANNSEQQPQNENENEIHPPTEPQSGSSHS